MTVTLLADQLFDAHDLGFIDTGYFLEHDLECLARDHVEIRRLPDQPMVYIDAR